jgi:protein-disulfide isomerase
VRDVDVVRNEEEAARMRIRSTPTVVVRTEDGTDVFRAEGVPTLTQLLAAAAKAL